jgi:hypothetical protein
MGSQFGDLEALVSLPVNEKTLEEKCEFVTCK